MSLPGLNCPRGPEPVTSVAHGQSLTRRAKADLRRKAREADELQAQLRRDFYERDQARTAA